MSAVNRGADSAMRALGRIPSGLFIITAGRGPSAIGTLVSFVQQLSFDPPCVGVAIRKGGGLEAALAPGTHFVLNIMHAGDKSLLRKYAKASLTGADAWSGLDAREIPAGGAVLPPACSFVECTVADLLDFGGDHRLVVGKVIAGELLGDPAAKPTVHIRHDGSRY